MNRKLKTTNIKPEPSAEPESKRPKLQKRAISKEVIPPSMTRSKICTKCSLSFKVNDGKKYYLCSDCYRRTFSKKKSTQGHDTRVLTHIKCGDCNTSEYLPFIPSKEVKPLCRKCFSAQDQRR